MKRTSMINVLSLMAVSVLVTLAQQQMPKSVKDESRWKKVEYTPPAECEDTPEQCAVKMLKEINIDVGDSPMFSVYRLGEMAGTNTTVVFVSRTVEGDDSVAGILYRVALSLGDVEDRSYSLDYVGEQYKCMRGHKNWSKSLCP